MKRRQHGFTLVELVMVIVIMGALSAVAFSKFSRDSFDVVAASGELVQAIRYAQDKSMSHSGAANYRIDITATGYTVTQSGSAIPHPVTNAPNYARTWSNISLSPAATITFDAHGTPIALGAPLTITVSKGSSSDSVTVEDVTGFTR